ncbi:MAG: hypothetical protein WB610_11680, partial [Rhodomicrobium sp.]
MRPYRQALDGVNSGRTRTKQRFIYGQASGVTEASFQRRSLIVVPEAACRLYGTVANWSACLYAVPARASLGR